MPVSSGDVTYENNAKYYAGEAATSETNAGTSESNAEAWAVGERGGVPVSSGDPTYQNNAYYWAQQASGAVSDMVGATALTAGVHGLVPAPAAGDQDKVLKGDGTWGNVSTVTDLASLTDTNITTPSNGQVLEYDSVSSKWVNASLGTAASKNSTNAVTQSSTDLVESGAVYTELQAKADDTKAYLTDDTTETTLASDDVLPFYDTSATTKKKMTVENIVGQTVSNPNLLDNPWFTVNQRGQNSYSGSVYGFDRWKGLRAVVTQESNGILVVFDNTSSTFGRIHQHIEDYSNLIGRTVTLSYMTEDGNVYSKTAVFPEKGGTSIHSGYVDNVEVALFFGSSDTYPVFGIQSNSTSNTTVVKAVKLELGSVSTLAMDKEPNYATELLKCQRYFFKQTISGGAPCYNGFSDSTTKARIAITTPVEMREKPSVIVDDISRFHVIQNGANIAATDISISKKNNNVLYAIVTVASGLQGDCYVVGTRNANGDVSLEFSADI